VCVCVCVLDHTARRAKNQDQCSPSSHWPVPAQWPQHTARQVCSSSTWLSRQ